MIEHGLTSQRPLILLAEDSEADARFAIQALGDHFATEIVVVHSSSEALDFLFYREHHGKGATLRQPHLILLDCDLPPDGGLEVLRRVRANDRTQLLPVVMLSSSQFRTDVKEYYEKGANSLVPKPVEADAFEAMMRQVCGFWLNCNIPPATL